MSSKTGMDYTEQEEADMLKLAGEIERVDMFKDFMKQYQNDFDNKIKKMNMLIDNDIDRLIIELNERRKFLKTSLSDLQKNKKHQIDAECKSLNKYSKILKQKASICSNLFKEAKKKDMDKTERETAIRNIINTEVQEAFEIYQEQFSIVSHFQSVCTRPSVLFGEYGNDDNNNNNNNDDEKKSSSSSPSKVIVNKTLNSIKHYGNVSEEPLKEFSQFLRELPQEMIAIQELQNVMKNKVETASAVFNNAKNNVTNLRMKDLNEINALTMNNVSEEIILVFEAIHLILKRIDDRQWNKIYKTFQNTKKRKQRWNDLKAICLEPTFVPNIFNLTSDNLTNKQLTRLNNNYIPHSLFKYNLIQKKNKSAAQIAHWIISLVRLRNFKTQLKSINADLQKHEKELDKQYNQKQHDLVKKQNKLKKQQQK